jgi:hypothetical protein
MPYSARVSILVEIAEQADVSVEGVVRVLTREPVSEAVKERVLAVLDDLTPEQTRAVQRFALAALHDVLLRPGHAIDLAHAPAAEADPPPELPAAAAGSDAALVQLGSVLGELAEAVRDLRRETDAERRERVDDLAVLIDLITTGWQGLDARLGRIEKQVSRLEAGRREPVVIAPARVAAPTIEQTAPPPAPVEPAEHGGRGKLPIVATLSLVGAAAVTLAVLQIASGGPDVTRLVSSRAATMATGEASSTTAAPTSTQAETRPAATTARPPAQSPTIPQTTSHAGTGSGSTTRSKPPAAPASPKTSTAPPAATTRPAATAASPTGFQPTRNWAWAPVKNAAYYDVVFTRGGKVFYAGSPTEPRLTLPSSLVFRPGAYRWIVRPGFGDRAAKNLGAPVVDSPFTVS